MILSEIQLQCSVLCLFTAKERIRDIARGFLTDFEILQKEQDEELLEKVAKQAEGFLALEKVEVFICKQLSKTTSE